MVKLNFEIDKSAALIKGEFNMFKFAFSNFILCLALAGMLIGNPAPTSAQAALSWNFEQEFQKADQNYRVGKFDDAITILVDCLAKPDLTEGRQLKIYRLLGLVYLAQDYEKNAQKAIDKLLNLVPDYKVDPTQAPTSFNRMVEEVRQGLEESKTKQLFIAPMDSTIFSPKADTDISANLTLSKVKKKSKKMLWIAGGAGAAGIATAFLLSKGSGNETLSGPPELPKPPGE